MTQHGRHRAPKSHAQPKLGKVSATTAFVAGAAVLLTGGITAAANSSEPEPIYVNSRALIIDSTVTYDVRDHVISESEITEDQEIEFPVEVIKDKNIAKGTELVRETGKPGKAEIIYLLKFVDDTEVSRTEISRNVVDQPVNEVIVRGTGDPKDLKVALATAEEQTGNKVGNKAYAKLFINQEYGWGKGQFKCLETLWFRESNWNHKAKNRSSGAYGIPQSLPGRKMAAFGDDWKTNPATQIKWGANYIDKRYGTPCEALDFFYSRNWY
jgi:hypothetical protein